MTDAAPPGARHSALLAALRDVVGSAHVLTAAHDVEPFVQDWRGRYRGEAQAVVLPGNTDEVAAVVRTCADAGVAVLPQGGNTGLVGGATPVGAQRADGTAPVIIALGRMNRVLEVDPIGNTLLVEAGCILENIQRTADGAGRLYGVTLGAQGSCQIGGNVSTNAGGTGVLKYGNTRDQVLGLEAVLPDGRVWNGLRALRKDNTGYALKHLFIGGEGTLGIVTRVRLRMHPKPAVWASAWLTFDAVDDALRCLAELQASAGDRISAFELVNLAQTQAVTAHFPELRPPTDAEAPYAVLLELSDTFAQADLTGLLESALSALAERGWLRDAAIAASISQREHFWRLRHNVTEANRAAGMGLSTDVAVPVAAVPRFIDAASEAVQARYPQTTIVIISHMGDGNVHFIPRFTFADFEAFGERKAIVADEVRGIVHDVAATFDGTFSAEHGVGHVLVEELLRLRAPIEIELMRRINDGFDPAGRMNPGKLLSRSS